MSNIKIILKNNTRIYATDLTDVANEAIFIQKTSTASSLILGVAMSVYSPLGLMQKKGFVQTIYSPLNASFKNIIVEAHFDGSIRAMIDNRNIITEYDNDIKKLNSIPLQVFTNKSGSLKIVKYYNGKTFGGEVNIIKGDFVTDLAYYFDQSEQIKSAVMSDVKLGDDKKFERVYSVIFQLLPSHNEEDLRWIDKIIKNKLSSLKTLDDFIKLIDGKEIECRDLIWKCKCSREKTKTLLKTLSEDEKQKIIDEYGKLEVICNFCTKDYIFSN